jgi:poly-gamma-glutamate capsule biosynthesis protein CapA/YwtB (metallophosphatase superfamily)
MRSLRFVFHRQRSSASLARFSVAATAKQETDRASAPHSVRMKPPRCRVTALALLALLPLVAGAAPLRVILTGQALIEHDARLHAPQKFAALRPLLHGRDVVFTNLEVVIQTGVGKPIKDSYLHAASTEVLDCLSELGFNLLALSNNHIGDLGPEGVLGAIRAIEDCGFVHAGAGATLELAAQPGLLKTQRGRVALVSAASGGGKRAGSSGTDQAGMNEIRRNREDPAKGLHPDDVARVLADIRSAAQHADLVIFYHHDHLWAKDMRDTPGWKQGWARACIDAGAHVFVSHGAPLLHGIELYRGRPIFYDLGGLFFHTVTKPGHYPPEVWESVIVETSFENGRFGAITLRPIVLNEHGKPGDDFFKTRGFPEPATPARAREILDRLAKLSAAYGTKLDITANAATIDPAN